MLNRAVIAALSVMMLVACAPMGDTAGQSVIAVKDAWARPVTVDMGDKPMSMGGNPESGHGMHDGAMKPMSAAYMIIENSGSAADRLIGATGDVAETFEVHLTREQNGMMVMEKLKDGVEVPARGTLVLKPASYHIMLIGVKHDLKVGDKFRLTLKFQSGKEVPVDVTVREP